jgi:hypothetical protein
MKEEKNLILGAITGDVIGSVFDVSCQGSVP